VRRLAAAFPPDTSHLSVASTTVGRQCIHTLGENSAFQGLGASAPDNKYLAIIGLQSLRNHEQN
jgi:hypothetical protein